MPARSLVPGEADGGRQFPVGALRLFLPVSQQGLPVLDEPPAADQVVVADAAKPELDELMTTVLKRQAIAYLLPQSKEPAVLEQIDYDAVRTAAQEATTKREVDAEEQRDLNRAQTEALQGMATDAKNSAQSQKNYNFSMLFLALVSLAVAVGAFIAAVR